MSVVARRRVSRVMANDAAQTAATGANIGYLPRQMHYQVVPYAATITVDPQLGSAVFVGSLTGNITVAAPTNPEIGDRLTFKFIQDATGGRTITWNAVFVSTPTTVTTTLARTSGSFIFDGTNWVG